MIPIFEPYFEGREKSYLSECINTGWISSQGTFIGDFEAAFAGYVGLPHGVATSSCTTALHLALAAFGVGVGDEVLCPDLTFIAPANMIALTGATPVLIDIEPGTWALDPGLAEAAITSCTKAIMVIHPFGHAADMDSIMALAKKHDLFVIEDVAEAVGAEYKNIQLGTIGDAACYSFFANKIMTTGEGGMVLSNNAGYDKSLRILRDHGMSRERRYHHVASGYNYRMTNMQAAIGLAQLEQMDTIHEIRNRQATLYAARFAECNNLTWRPTAEWCQPVHWLATITLATDGQRDPLLDHMKERGVEGRPMIFPIHDSVPFRDQNPAEGFPVSHEVSYRSLHLPSSTGLADDQINYVADVVIDWVNGR